MMTRLISVKCIPIFLVCFVAAGCLSPMGQRARDEILFDTAGGTTWRNHLKVVPDPAGSSRKVFRSDRVSRNKCQVVFVRKGGFFTVPNEHRGAVMVRALVTGPARVKVTLVSGRKIKSYYRVVPVQDNWCNLVLPLSHIKEKIRGGDAIEDITLFLLPPEKGTPLEKKARLYVDQVLLLSETPDLEGLRQAAEKTVLTSRESLAPVYGPLAAHIVRDMKLADKTGLGIDLGSGPGDLIIELAKRTKMHWINADINPAFIPHFYDLAKKHKVGDRVSAMYADAMSMPLRDESVDGVVSRGCYHFWPNLAKGFNEVYRILKPGGIAYIGRGLSENLPPAIARQVRESQGARVSYDREKEVRKLRAALKKTNIPEFTIHLPQPGGSEGINYGVWVEFQKAAK